jgi:hypothetical protein
MNTTCRHHPPNRFLPSALAILLLLVSGCGRNSSKEAEQAVEQFYQALYKMDWAQAAEMFHTEGLETIRQMVLRIAETPNSPSERRQLLDGMGFTSVAQLRTADAKMIFARFFQLAWGAFSAEFRQMWRSTTMKVIGSVREGDVYHVVVRTSGQIRSVGAAVVSVASAKQDAGKWTLLSAAEFQNMLGKTGP